MRPLNFATRPLRNEVLPALLFAFACVLLLGATVEHVVVLRWLLSGTTSAVRQEVAALEVEEARLRGDVRRQSPQPSKETLDRWALVKELVDRRTFSWTRLLASLEKATPPDVRLISIAPSIKDGKVSLGLDAVARSSERGLDFVKALEQHPEFADVYPLSAQETEDGALFKYSMRYLPPPGGPGGGS